MFKYIILIVFLLLFLNSCMDEESPVEPYPRGDVQTATIGMSSKYINQIYFSFEKGEPVSSYVFDIWDLAFKSYGEDSYHIILNGAKFMEAADMGAVDFASVISRTDAPFKYDSSNGDYDNYAIGRWWESSGSEIISKNHVYIVNRGNNISNRKVGFVKFMVIGFENNEYKIKFANLDNSNEFVASIPRDANYNYTYFSFDDGGKLINVEPPSQDWDILFNKYVAILSYEEDGKMNYLPYSVTGVTINERYVEAASDTTMNFNSITLDSIRPLTFYKRPDYIGHEWKTFNLTGESYAVRPEINYFLKDKNAFFWKFHFTFFYNEQGERGYPKFDFKRL